MLQALITSKTRIRLLLKFFLNSSNTSYLRDLANEFGTSTNSIRLELNRFEEAGLLKAHNEGMRKLFRANTEHPLFGDINSLVRKYVGVDKIIERVIDKLGKPKAVYLSGELAKGNDSDSLHLIIIGDDIDMAYLENLVGKAQDAITRKIFYRVFTPETFQQQAALMQEHALLVWQHKD